MAGGTAIAAVESVSLQPSGAEPDPAAAAAWMREYFIRARAVYRSAMTSPTYDRWPFKNVLEQRLADADQNAAAYKDADPWNDPAVWAGAGKVCSGCHQQ